MPTEPSSKLPTVLVLASGRGERFAASGGTVHKLQASLAGRTVLERTLAAVRASGLSWHLEDAGHPGMGDSIAAAVAATPNACGWLILPADLPLVLPETLRAVANALLPNEGGHEVVVPVVQGQRGHPVGFAAVCRADLLKLQGDRGAASVIRSHDASELIVDDIGCVTDIDTLDDLARAEALLRRAG
ncbi:MAG: Molybdenum cofactor cytidylyltransferase [Burkholderiaceae bacterium]|jgi:molybdenum cofactor cytidylyltransferase|nr:MAG: Molybdenum cofactor cytidylyltransferase [Burkholderiaceae bacterium]